LDCTAKEEDKLDFRDGAVLFDDFDSIQNTAIGTIIGGALLRYGAVIYTVRS
jgi:hypothetical protein